MFYFSADDDDVKVMEVNFNDLDVCKAFTKLFAIFRENIKVSNEEFQIIRNACLARANKPLSDSIRQAKDINHLFEILADNSKYVLQLDECHIFKSYSNSLP